MRRWINLKKVVPKHDVLKSLKFDNWLATWDNQKTIKKAKDNGKGMAQMLECLGLELTGKHHSGIDDTRNIAKVCQKVIEHGFIFNQAMINDSSQKGEETNEVEN